MEFLSRLPIDPLDVQLVHVLIKYKIKIKPYYIIAAACRFIMLIILTTDAKKKLIHMKTTFFASSYRYIKYEAPENRQIEYEKDRCWLWLI